ncbi:MAG: hypothetical protein ACYCQI_08760 [Gammaproteobacteria bacterium]
MTINRTLSKAEALVLHSSQSTEKAVKPPIELMPILLEHLTSDLSMIVLLYSDPYLQAKIVPDFDGVAHHLRHSFFKLRTDAKQVLNEFKEAVFNAEQDEKLQYKAAKMLKTNPHLATTKMPLELPDGSTVMLTALQKTMFSLDERLRHAILATGCLSKAEITQQLQELIDESAKENRHWHVDMTRWNNAYQTIKDLENEYNYSGSDRSVVSVIGGAQEEMRKLAPNIFPHQFWRHMPFSSIPDYASELAEKKDFKRDSKYYDRDSDEDLMLNSNSGLGLRFYFYRGSHSEPLQGKFVGWGAMGRSFKVTIEKDFEAIAEYVKQEILLAERLFRNHGIEFVSKAPLILKLQEHRSLPERRLDFA